MRRLLVLTLLLSALLAPVARAQDANPFDDGLSTPTPTATAAPDSSSDDTSSTTLYLIAGGVLVVFLGIGWFITRDARRNLTAEDRRAIERGDIATNLDDDRGVGTVGGKKKAQRRKQTKAQRQARKANRPRRR